MLKNEPNCQRPDTHTPILKTTFMVYMEYLMKKKRHLPALIPLRYLLVGCYQSYY
jgi:hypothetical protein